MQYLTKLYNRSIVPSRSKTIDYLTRDFVFFSEHTLEGRFGDVTIREFMDKQYVKSTLVENGWVRL